MIVLEFLFYRHNIVAYSDSFRIVDIHIPLLLQRLYLVVEPPSVSGHHCENTNNLL